MPFDEEPDADPHGECAAEINRLRGMLETAIDLLCGARSGHVGGSQADCEWDSRKDALLRDFRNAPREVTE